MPLYPERSSKGLILASLLLIFFAINESFFSNLLFSASLQKIESIQASFQSSLFKYLIIGCFALEGDTEIISLLFLVYFLVKVDKIFALKLFLYGSSALYILSLLKMFYSSPRPYWVDTDIIPME